MKPTIKMIFSIEGSSKLETIGFKGKSCTDATKFLENEFETSAVNLKPEFYQVEATKHINQISG